MSIKQIKKMAVGGAATAVTLYTSAIYTLAGNPASGQGKKGGLSFENTNSVGQGVDDRLKGTTTDFSQAVQNMISYTIKFLYLVAVCYALWGGFQILTAGGDEDKVKKGKTILIQAAIGLFVIFIASSLVAWIIKTISSTTSGEADSQIQIILSLIGG